MQLIINIQDIIPNRKISELISGIKELFEKERVFIEIKQENSENDDSWDNLDINEIAIDTGIEDFAENHDYYLYGTPKHS
ncbi:MAG: hypothetical protein GY862_20440 [Gammaproteobacteria bacterium]|nr:hypothetical protein [Gammaproteobacteria bacterium]